MKPFGNIALWPSSPTTDTSTLPVACAGVLQVMRMVDSTVIEAQGSPPRNTLVPAVKLVPLKLTSVPPAGGPKLGVMLVRVGAGRAE